MLSVAFFFRHIQDRQRILQGAQNARCRRRGIAEPTKTDISRRVDVRPMRRVFGNTLQRDDNRVRKGECRVDTDHNMIDQRMAVQVRGHVYLPCRYQPKARERAFLFRTQAAPRAGPGLIQTLLNLLNLVCREVQTPRPQPKRPLPSLRTSDLSDVAIKNAFLASSLTVGSGSFWK
jgi:hypothetical protein